MIEIVVGPFVNQRRLGGSPVPDIDILRKKSHHRAVPVTEIVPAHLAVIIR